MTVTRDLKTFDGASFVVDGSASPIPPGTVNAFAGINTPTGWLACDGSSITRATYPLLFASITKAFTGATITSSSTTVSGLSGMTSAMVGWGIAGNGIPTAATISSVSSATTVVISANATVTQTATAALWIGPFGFTGANNTTTFKIPDLRGRTTVGKDDMGGSDAGRLASANVIGTAGGSATSTAAHTHSVDHDHGSFNATSGGQSQSHVHGLNGLAGYDNGQGLGHGRAAGTQNFGINNNTGWADRDHTHTTAIDVPNYAGTSGPSSVGAADGNMPPFLTLTYIIKI